MADWKITWRGVSFTGDDLLASDLSYLSTLTGDGWAAADPWRGPAHTANLIGVYLSRVAGRTIVEVLDEVAAASAMELVSALGIRSGVGELDGDVQQEQHPDHAEPHEVAGQLAEHP